MTANIIFPGTYRNCCKIPHWISSIIICCIVSILELIVLITSISSPSLLRDFYGVGGTDTQIIIGGSVMSGFQLITNIILGFGIANDGALLILVWVIGSILFWNVHLILCLAAVVFHSYNTSKTTFDTYRVILILSIQLLWLLFIIMVGRHWYAICEDMYALEYGTYPSRGHSRRMYNVSNRSYRTISHFSTRMPMVLHRIERNR